MSHSNPAAGSRPRWSGTEQAAETPCTGSGRWKLSGMAACAGFGAAVGGLGLFNSASVCVGPPLKASDFARKLPTLVPLWLPVPGEDLETHVPSPSRLYPASTNRETVG